MGRRLDEGELTRRARELYLAGLEPEQAALRLGLDPARVSAWAAAGQWPARRAAWFGDPRGAASRLRALLAARVEELVGLEGLDAKAADELAKIGALAAKLEGSGYELKAAAVEVGERLAALAAAQGAPADRRQWLAGLLDGLFAALERGEE